MLTSNRLIKGSPSGFYVGVWAETSKISPFMCSIFYVVPLIPYFAISKTILVKTLIFFIFTLVDIKTWKQPLKQKRRIISKTQNIFSMAKH